MRKVSQALCLLGSGSLLVATPTNDFTVHCTNGDLNGVDQIAVVGCLLAGGGSFTGTVKLVKNDTQVLITLTGAGAVPGMFTGASTGLHKTERLYRLSVHHTSYWARGSKGLRLMGC
jgi:hypothetical protein